MPMRWGLVISAMASSTAVAQPLGSLAAWSSMGGDEARSAARRVEVGDLSSVRWVRGHTDAGLPIRYSPHAGIVATVWPVPRVFAAAVVDGQTRALAIDAETGHIVWMTPIPPMAFDSWSSPVLDPRGGVVIYAAGSSVIALRTSNGAELWRTDLPGPPVNVSPLLTRDLGFANRLFVTDYGGFGGESSLFCINVSPYHETINPFNPGQIVWSTPIGSSNGASPAYHDGVVYVCSTGLDGDGRGQIRAFDARSTTPPSPLWTFSNPIAEGFFGGLALREGHAGPYVYAASYAFFGSFASANMVKVRARTGELVWSVPSNRTSSVPIVLEDGRIVLSSGLSGFGTVPMVQMFRDHGGWAEQLWNTAQGTWQDANQNGRLDSGEYLAVGGWTTQPLLARGRTPGSTDRLIVGAIPAGSGVTTAYTTLYELDLSKSPAQPGFVARQTPHAGSTAALLGAGVYSVGVGGLAAMGPPPPGLDVNADGVIDTDDLASWEQGQGSRDVDRNGIVTEADREMLLFELRRNETRELSEGGR